MIFLAAKKMCAVVVRQDGVGDKNNRARILFLRSAKEDPMVASNTVTTRLCSICHQPIAPARLEALPATKLCIECAQTHPPEPIDPATLDLSQASPINKNGFAPSD